MYYLSLLFTLLAFAASAGWTNFNGNFVMTTASGGAGTVTGSVIWSWTQGKMYFAFNTGVSGSSWTETYDWNSTYGYSGAGTDNPQYLFTYGSTCSPNCAAASIATGQPPLNPAGSYLNAASGSGTCLTYTPSASASNSFMVYMTASSSQVCSFKLTDGRLFTMTSFTTSASTITTPSGCSCSQSVDIMFLVDHSASISTAQMGQFKTFVTNFLGNLTISSSAVNVGMTYFSKATTTYTASNFPMTGTPSVVTSGMNGWAVPCGGAATCSTQPATATPYGIQVAADALYSSVRQVPKILMTLTDGATNTDQNNNGCCKTGSGISDAFTYCNPAIDTAITYLKNKKANAGYTHTLTMIAVGVGTECSSSDKQQCTPTCKYTPHLTKFADGISSNVLSVNDWTALQTQVATLMSLSCSTSNNAQQNTCLQTCGGLCVCGGCSPPTGCSNSSACYSYTLTGSPAQCQATAIPCPSKTCQVSTCNTTLNACTYTPVDCSSYKGGCNNCSKYTCATSGATAGQCTVQDNSACGTAVDCVQSDWGSWTTCTASCGGGTATATRTTITQPSNCGAACGATTQTFACNTQTCSTPCTVSDWSVWGSCSVSCGGGTQTQSRTITANATNGGTACPTLTQSQSCNSNPCPVDCVWYPWGSWSPCTVTCGGGTTTETRTIQTQAANGGNNCSGSSTNTTSCNNNPCPINCVWSTWSDYGTCTTTCGGGSQTRTRTQTPPASYGGTNCTGNFSDTQTCNTNGCPVNCSWGPWGAWGSCSVSCAAGTQTQTRTISIPAANGGVDCKASDGTNTAACNNGPCPINCVWGNWGAWGSCSVPCGGGTQTQTRNITTPAQYGGVNCTGYNNQSQTCNTNGCPVNCTWSAWGAASSCSKSCGGGTNTRTRYVVNASANGGTPCNLTDDTQIGQCNNNSCPVDCVWSTWSAWGVCSKTCGGGTQQSTRTITTNSSNGGAACGTVSTQDQTCNTQNCPIDCVGAWTPWANCSCLYQNQSRTYSVSTPAQYNGTNCSFNNGDVQSQGCNVTSCVPIDCNGTWSANSTCSCTDNSTYQVFTIFTPASNNGTDCNYSTGATRSFYCDPVGCPVDCSGYWTANTTCACVVNSSTQTFIITTPAQNNGVSCGFLNGTVNTSYCDPVGCPVDCQGQWSSWTTCDCGTSNQNRTFTQTVAKQNSGADCNPGVGTIVYQSCTPTGCPVDCDGFYSQFSVCACATNTSQRTWTITTNSSNGGNSCNDTNGQVEQVACVAQQCPADCQGHWTSWGSCDCANSQYNRSYVVDNAARYGGAGCEANDGDIGYGSCTPVNCPVPCSGYWSSWGSCDCSNSSKTRVFYVTVAAQNNGAACDPPSNLTIGTTGCTPQGCPVDCVGGWSSWSVCSCATGNQTRSFSITVPRQFAGANCSNNQGDHDYQSCNTSSCPVDCQGNWNEWSVCSCATSRQTRTWNQTVAPQNGGVACPGQQAQSCTPSGCPVDCVGEWGEWGTCPCSGTSTDGTTSSTQNRTYIVTTQPLFGGKNCSPANGTIGSTSCTAQGCPVDCQGEWGSWGNCSCFTLTKTRTFTITRNQSNGGQYCIADEGAIGSLNCDPTGCKVYPPDCSGPNDTISCIDSSACTQNLCILFDDNKYHCDWSTPVDCNDNSVCTSDSCDEVKGCQYIPKVCDDNTACTVDTCDNVTGCVFTNVTCTVNATEWCAIPICDAVTGCGKATRICPSQGQTDNCTQMICDPHASSNATACKALQLCGFDPVIAAVITAGAIAGIAVGCGIVALGAVSGASYAIATQTGAAAAVHTQGNPLYEASHAAGTNLMGENPN